MLLNKEKKEKGKRKRASASSMSYTQLLTISKIEKTHDIGKTKRETRKGELFLGSLLFIYLFIYFLVINIG